MELKTEPANDTALRDHTQDISGNQCLPALQGKPRRYRLAVLSSHVIQYQDPLFKKLAAEPDIDLTVFFCSDWGAVAYRDPGFGRKLEWDLPLRQGYEWNVLPNWSLRPNPSRFWGLINPGIVERVARGRYDAIWVHGWSNCTAWMAMLAAFVFNVPVLLRGDSQLLSSSPGSLRQVIKRHVLTRLFHKASAFLAIGTSNARFYRSYGAPPERIFHVPYSVDNERLLSSANELLASREAIRSRLNIPRQVPVVLFSGKLIPVKAPMDLLKAFELANAVSPAHLVFVGDGELGRELKDYVSCRNIPNVHFVGFQNQRELASFFVAADIFVLPSAFDQWGLVVNEALCFGLPVIVSDQVGASADLVEHGQNGFVFPSGDVSALSQCLAKLFSDDVLRRRMAQASQRRIHHWNFEADIAGIRASLHAVTKTTL
jgi:glycosyltransferase involved in cell wall biosynthesis